LSEKGIEVYLIGLTSYNHDNYKHTNIQIHIVDLTGVTKTNEGSFNKLNYLKALPFIKRKIKEIKPDILHAHYASSYGLLGALCGFHPYIISVWGSDIFEFPNISPIHKQLIKFNFRKADILLSTSKIMAKETSKYTNKNIQVTPFGIDLGFFKPQKDNDLLDQNEIVIGTIKNLETIYGIEYLIKAFAILKNKYSSFQLKLLIVGGGSLEEELKKICIDLQIEKSVTFRGKIEHKEILQYHNMIDIFVALSLSESFGVAILESQACEKPVVVSNVGGLPEVIEENITGFIVPPKNAELAANAIEKLILDKELRTKMGKAGRERVMKHYEWNGNVNLMVDIYKSVCEKYNL
jgi:glycosyltransferase involved in cell wall biosynthesis